FSVAYAHDLPDLPRSKISFPWLLALAWQPGPIQSYQPACITNSPWDLGWKSLHPGMPKLELAKEAQLRDGVKIGVRVGSRLKFRENFRHVVTCLWQPCLELAELCYPEGYAGRSFAGHHGLLGLHCRRHVGKESSCNDACRRGCSRILLPSFRSTIT